MKALLDTHTFLWWNKDDPQLSLPAREFISDGQNEIFLSAASVWEIVIKTAKGKLILPEEPSTYIAARMSLYQFQPLTIQIRHTLSVYNLPPYHTDPFDRLLIAQCMVESMPLISADPNIRHYGLDVIW